MTTKIKSKAPLIPDSVDFECGNCGTEFEADKFEIRALEAHVREEPFLSILFSKYNRVWWTKSIYRLTADCPTCEGSCSALIDRELPENRNEILQKDAWI